jgi:hypothetical protein
LFGQHHHLIFEWEKNIQIQQFKIFPSISWVSHSPFLGVEGGSSILWMAVARSLGMSCGARDPGGRQDPGVDEGKG